MLWAKGSKIKELTVPTINADKPAPTRNLNADRPPVRAITNSRPRASPMLNDKADSMIISDNA